MAIYDYDYYGSGRYGKGIDYRPYSPKISVSYTLKIHFQYIDYKLSELKLNKKMNVSIISEYLSYLSNYLNIPISVLSDEFLKTVNIEKYTQWD